MNFYSFWDILIPRRSFVSYLISLSTTVHGLKDKVFLSDECRIDLRFWYTFLLSWNGIIMLYDTNYTRATEMELYTDASSTVGYGGYSKGMVLLCLAGGSSNVDQK